MNEATPARSNTEPIPLPIGMTMLEPNASIAAPASPLMIAVKLIELLPHPPGPAVGPKLGLKHAAGRNVPEASEKICAEKSGGAQRGI
jgi:hypothetical protein